MGSRRTKGDRNGSSAKPKRTKKKYGRIDNAQKHLKLFF